MKKLSGTACSQLFSILTLILLFPILAHAQTGPGITALALCSTWTSPVKHQSFCLETSTTPPTLQYWDGAAWQLMTGSALGDFTDVNGTADQITSSASTGPATTLALAAPLDLSAKTLKGGTPLCFDGATAGTNKTCFVVTDPTANRNITVPNANSVTIQAATCSGGYVSAVSALGALTCTTAPSGSGAANRIGFWSSASALSSSANFTYTSGALNSTSTSANAVTVGRQGTTDPALKVDASVASSATGIGITARAATAGVTLAAISSGSNEQLKITGKGTGSVQIGTHLETTGTAPAVSNTSANSCGTTAATIVGTDNGGKVTVGAVSGTSCTVTFATAFTNAPACVANNETTANLLNAISTTTTVILSGTMVGGDVLTYVCMGYS